MAGNFDILGKMPTADEFYGNYWHQRPFVARNAISSPHLSDLITGDELAGLSLEESAQSRIVTSSGDVPDWSCRYGPFTETDLHALQGGNWSLLVQNVEQFHPDTAVLLRYFDFAPRWLIDDIMVSYSSIGGSVGPHLDSYHVFLVQGTGCRRWTVSDLPLSEPVFVAGTDLRILDGPFSGQTIEVTEGDVLYIPPGFAHEGNSLVESMTYSVGFLGPKMSDLFGGYGQYLAERERQDARYTGRGLDIGSAGFVIDLPVVTHLREILTSQFDSVDFGRWVTTFFTQSSHEEFGSFDLRLEPMTASDFVGRLRRGESLIKPAYVKFAVSGFRKDGFWLAVDGQGFDLEQDLFPVIKQLMSEDPTCPQSLSHLLKKPEKINPLLDLYNHNVLEFVDPN